MWTSEGSNGSRRRGGEVPKATSKEPQAWSPDDLFKFYDVNGDGNLSAEERKDGRLPTRNGDYRWICYTVEQEEKELAKVRKKAGMDEDASKEDSEHMRLQRKEDSERKRLRQAATKMTQLACRKASYPFDGQIVQLRDVPLMEKGTRWFYHDDDCQPPKGPLNMRVTTQWSSYHQEGAEVHTVALECPVPSKVACVNLASAYTPAHGFYEGEAHTVTDAVHVRSTLSRSIDQADIQRLTVPTSARPSRPMSGGQWTCHLPWKGVLLSPKVEFFRGSRKSGYPFQGKATTLGAVISIALPCCKEIPDFQPADRPDSDEDYSELLVHKFKATLGAAMFAGATVVVVPDMADSAYGNDCMDVGWAFGETVRRYFPYTFDEIRIVGNKEFAEVAEASYRGEMALSFWKEKTKEKFARMRKEIEEKQAEVDKMFNKIQLSAKKLEADRRKLDERLEELSERDATKRVMCFLCPAA